MIKYQIKALKSKVKNWLTVAFINLFILNLSAQIPDSSQSISILKNLSFEELMNIKVITASGSMQTISEAPSTIIVITAQQIKDRGYEELDDALRDIAGIDLTHAYGNIPVIRTFRGMYGDENKRILIMIDGIVENNITGDVMIGSGAVYSLHNIERIEIVWGPASALYGANAFGGVINMITKKGKDINGLQFQRGLGSFNTFFEKLMVGIEKSKFDISFSMMHLNSDGPKFANHGINYSNSYIANSWSFYGNIGYSFKNTKTTLGFRAFESPTGIGTIRPVPTKILGLPDQGNENKGVSGIVQSDIRGEKPTLWDPFTRTLFLQNEYNPNSKFNLFSRVQYRQTGISDRSYAYYQFAENKPVSRSIFTNSSNRIQGDIIANYSVGKYHKLTAGIQLSQANIERGYRGTNPDTNIILAGNIPITNINATFKAREYAIQNNFGSFLQYVLSTNLLGKTDFTVGGRYDVNSVYGSTVNPRIAIVNRLNNKVGFKLLAGTAFRAPTNFELYAIKGVGLDNLDLQPEKIRTYEANIILNPSKFYLIQISGFRNEITNIIEVQKIGLYTQGQNIGSAIINGGEAKLNLLFSKQFSSFFNFTYQEGTQTTGTTKINIPNIAKIKGNVGFSYYFLDLFSLSLISNYVGIRSVPSTNPFGKVGQYLVTNIVFSTNNLFDNRVSVSLNIRNITNQKYFDPGIRTADGKLYSTVLEQPGINGLFKITINLL